MSAEILNLDARRLAARARRLAERAEPAAARDQDAVGALSFRLGDERFALPVNEVASVVPFGAPTPVPGASPALIGVMAIKGEVHTVFNLARLLGLPEVAGDPAGGYVLLLRLSDARVGVAVTQVHAIVTGRRAGQTGEAHARPLIAVGDEAFVLIEDLAHTLAPHIHGDGQ